jgi:hypothetical protein
VAKRVATGGGRYATLIGRAEHSDVKVNYASFRTCIADSADRTSRNNGERTWGSTKKNELTDAG